MKRIYCEICRRDIQEYPITVPVCEECIEKSKMDAYEIIVPVTGYYVCYVTAKSEEDAKIIGAIEISEDYEPEFVVTEKLPPQVKKVYKDGTFNYYKGDVEAAIKKYKEEKE